MSEDDDYESLGDDVSLRVTMFAGAVAGVMEHCCMFPVDVIKTRQQALACDKTTLQSKSIIKNGLHIVKTEGFPRLFQGVQTMAAGAGPAHAVYFGCYETLKSAGLKVTAPRNISESFVHTGAGAVATVFHDAVMCPADVVKQRMQMCCSPYSSGWDCARTVFRKEGIKAFYRSYSTVLSMNVPFQCIVFATYEKMKKLTNPSGEYNPLSHWVSGAVAGAMAATVTMPLDVCKTLLNTQEANVLTRLQTNKVVGIVAAITTVKKMAGFRGFFKGLWPRVCYQIPSTAISWSCYEFFKYLLHSWGADSSPPGEDTIEDLRREQQRQAASRLAVTEEDGRAQKDSRFWENIRVSDLARPQAQVLAESRVSSSELVQDRTFPGYRT